MKKTCVVNTQGDDELLGVETLLRLEAQGGKVKRASVAFRTGSSIFFWSRRVRGWFSFARRNKLAELISAYISYADNERDPDDPYRDSVWNPHESFFNVEGLKHDHPELVISEEHDFSEEYQRAGEHGHTRDEIARYTVRSRFGLRTLIVEVTDGWHGGIDSGGPATWTKIVS